MMYSLHFAHPDYFWLMLMLPAAGIWYWRSNRKLHATVQVSTLESYRGLPVGWKVRLRHLPFILRLLALAALITALARPQTNMSRKDIQVEGIDIVLATDISSTMLSEDLKPNRLEAAKEVGIQFIQGRPNDRIGLVVFSGESFTQCPVTIDHSMLINQFKQVKFGLIDDGTAIGEGLATAVNRLKDSKAKSKVVILLTDGMNNTGVIDPLSAADMATLYGIRIYTIGAGTTGYAPTPVQTPFGMSMQMQPVEIDEALLQKISAMTSGKYFRAVNKQKLQAIYHEIDKLERSRIDVTEYTRKKEQFLIFALAGLILLGLEVILRQTLFRTLP